ncbi:MAG: hypothetical protein JWL90_166 [Chthoniobacteraceae bacterium]|nr:hypothetical protein [Chthoniobacteraceae bacterium]
MNADTDLSAKAATTLRVLLVEGHWVVKTDTGASVIGPDNQADAVALARQVGAAQDASEIAVYSADGTLEKTVAI